MRDRKDDESAFPWLQTSDSVNGGSGMSLRDYFAGQAIIGLLTNEGLSKKLITDSVEFGYDGPCKYFAESAYEMADAMIAQGQDGD